MEDVPLLSATFCGDWTDRSAGADIETGETDVDANTPGSENQAAEGATPERDELPLPDFDHIPLGTLPSRLHPLDERAITQLLGWERVHGNRLPVIQVLESRIEQLRSGAEPSGSIPENMPEVTSNQTGSPVSPTTSPDVIPEPAKSSPMLPSQPQ